MFNIAAMNNLLVSNENLNNEESLQNSNRKLQMAAGIFSYLMEEIAELMDQELTLDLQPDCLSFLSSLCYAQAQELVLQKALKVKFS